MRVLKFVLDHVIFKLRYNQIYQLKTTLATLLQHQILESWFLNSTTRQTLMVRSVCMYVSTYVFIYLDLDIMTFFLWHQVTID